MELLCEKYKQKMDNEGASCRYPNEYCKFRTACIIHFMAKQGGSNEKSLKTDKDMPLTLHFEKGNGLLPAIVQDNATKEVLMLAYINEESWNKTLETGKAHYWSRSRNSLWLKGESSGHVQVVKEILVDCDEDTVIFKVEQKGGAACHKGYRSCFYRRVEENRLHITDEPVFDPKEVYKR